MIDLKSPIVAEAASHFDTTPAALVPMVGGHATAVYEFVRGGSAYVLRILPPGEETSPSAIAAIQAWVVYLAEQGAPVPSPLQTTQGQEIVVIERSEGTYIAVAVEKARGVRAETLGQDDWTDVYFERLGETAARLHFHATDYAPPPDLRRPDVLSTGGLFSLDQPAAPAIVARKRAVLAQLASLPRSPAHYGMIHGDFHFGNFFVDPGNGYAVTVFDFDDCGYGWYLMDTATLVFDIAVLYEGPDREAFVAHFLRHYLVGYQRIRPVEPVWLAQLPHFLKLLEISYYALLAPLYESGSADDDWWVMRFMPGRKARVETGVPYLELDPVTLLKTRS